MRQPTVSIAISSDIYAEFLFRKMDKKLNVPSWIENILSEYLDRTENEDYWAEEYYEWKGLNEPREDFIEKYGDPEKGYHWSNVFLPNGTTISMKYKGRTKYATVIRGKIIYEKKAYSPAELARVIANNTSRNAWRDLYLKRPKDERYILSDDLRQGKKILTLEDL